MLTISRICLSLLGWSLLQTVASQVPLGDFGAFDRYDQGLFSPLDDLSLLSDNQFTTLSHPSFPGRSVRIKKSHFCDGTVKSYTGYIDVYNRHLFFYFFESRHNPDKDDVIFWTNGGPGGSSAFGLFMELGPCRVLDEDGPKYHPESWNSNANVFFIDQPVGVGFSYADFGSTVDTTEEAAKDIAAFVAIFFEHFSKFKGRPFHMAGESYGGRYIPLFAAAVYDQNTELVKAGLTPINLTSIMIGNGYTSPIDMYDGLFKMSCVEGSPSPALDINTCVIMKLSLPRCQKMMLASCVDSVDAISCKAAYRFCEDGFYEPYMLSGVQNPYDITKDCEGSVQETICYPVIKHISRYLSDKDVRQQIGVDPSLPANFSIISWEVNSAFAKTLDEVQPTCLYVAQLLERGVRVLIYVGENDFICNWHGNEAWTLDLDWSGRDEFVKEELKEWKVDGKAVGKTRSKGGLTFATVHGAGHMVPYDKPKEALVLVDRWLGQEDL